VANEFGQNEGIIITGGELNSRNVVVGKGSTLVDAGNEAAAALDARGQEELAARLSALISALEQHSTSLENAQATFASAMEMADQLRAEKPSKPDILATLERIAGGVRSVAGVAVAVEALKVAVLAFL
jgi:hypothetical protein